MNCPKCGGDCYDNIEENKTRKLEGKKERPEYSCKDKEGCGWVLWPAKDGRRQILRETGPLPPKIALTNGELREKTMVMSYAKDCVVKKIEVGIAEPGDTAHQIIAIYRALMSELNNPLGKV